MQIHYEDNWSYTHHWWVTWCNHRLFRSAASIKTQVQLIDEITEWFGNTKINYVVEQNYRGKAGYGFKTREDALMFYLRWQDSSVGIFE